ncbi:hypothetical protein EDD15DRAFT_2362438 [Pisolithus albus]|nr:hypothetical protein EDD15DRAFT_2362438 [Pisolithus albus]
MSEHSIHINPNEAVSSRDDEIELVDAISQTAIKHRPHILRLQVPTSIRNVTVSFEPKSQGPVTIELSLTATLPEFMVITDPSRTTSAYTHLATNSPNVTDGEVKLESADANLSASTGPLHMDSEPLPAGLISAPFSIDHRVSSAPAAGCTVDSASTGDNCIESANVQPVLPCVLVVNDNAIDLESVEGTPRPVEKIASELLPSPPPARSPHWSPKRSFTPDSFAASEEFDIVNTQLLRERWAQIREDLVAGQECRRPIFSEVTTPTPPQICLSIVVLARDDIYRLLRLPGFVSLDSVSAITPGNKLFIASTEI